MSEDFYEILGVSRDADQDEIRRAYRKKAAKYHPDVSDEPNAEEKFKKVKKAKEVLSDEEKRQLYDQLGHDRFEQMEKQGGVDAGAAGAGGPFGGDPFDGGLGDIFEEFFGGRRRSREGPRKGPDLRTELVIDLEDAYRGVEKQMTVTRPERCPTCDGTGHPPGADPQTCPECGGRGQVTQVSQTPFGRMQQTSTCRRCNGEGRLYTETCTECRGEGQVRREATLEVEVPAGIEDGQTLRMEGEGAPGERGGPNGDLLIDIAIEDHPRFERDGADLHLVEPLSFPQAVFGDTVTVSTFDGDEELRIPPGTQSGETFRVKGQGMPRLRSRRRGDLYVRVQVVTPTELTEEQREALEAFVEAGGEDVDVEAGRGLFDRIKSSL